MFENIIGNSYVLAIWLLLFGTACILAWFKLDQVDQPIIKNLVTIPGSKPVVGMSQQDLAEHFCTHISQDIFPCWAVRWENMMPLFGASGR